MVFIIVKKSGNQRKEWDGVRKDHLDKRRKQIAEELQDGIMSKSQMKKGHDGDGNEDKQTARYDDWKNRSHKGKTNEERMREWHGINKEFKKHGEEGKVHSLDDIRPDGKMKIE